MYPASAGQLVVGPLAEPDGVGPVDAGRVHSIPAIDLVVPLATADGVRAVTTDQIVVTCIASEVVVVVPGAQPVCTRPAPNVVTTKGSVEEVGSCSEEGDIVPGVTQHGHGETGGEAGPIDEVVAEPRPHLD